MKICITGPQAEAQNRLISEANFRLRQKCFFMARWRRGGGNPIQCCAWPLPHREVCCAKCLATSVPTHPRPMRWKALRWFALANISTDVCVCVCVMSSTTCISTSTVTPKLGGTTDWLVLRTQNWLQTTERWFRHVPTMGGGPA